MKYKNKKVINFENYEEFYKFIQSTLCDGVWLKSKKEIHFDCTIQSCNDCIFYRADSETFKQWFDEEYKKWNKL